MEQTFLANRSSASQEIPHVSWKQKVHCRQMFLFEDRSIQFMTPSLFLENYFNIIPQY